MKTLSDFQYALDLLETVLKDGSIDKRKMLHHKIVLFLSFHRHDTEFQTYTQEHLNALKQATE